MSDGDQEIFQRRITRRGLVGGGAAFVLGGSFLAACGGDSQTDAAPPATTSATETGAAAETGGTQAAGEPKQGGRLKIAFGQDIVNIGTADWGYTGFTIGYAVFDRLLRLTPDGKSIEPELVTELPELSEDGLTYTFKIRPGVMFHDGTEMTAEDVKYSLERAMDNNGPGQAQSLYGPLGITGAAAWQNGDASEVTGLRVIDPLTMAMDLDAPNSAVPYTLTMTMASIVPKAYTEQIGTKEFEQQPIGSGPFKITSYEPGRSLVMDRNPDYWDPSRAAFVDGADWELGVDAELATLRILNGEADFTHDKVPPGQIAQLQGDPNFLVGPFNNVFYVAGSTEHPAMKELAVRQAMAHAVDKERIVRQLAGVGEPATGGIFSPLSPYYQEGLGYPYDPEAAKQLLADAGFPDGFEVELLIRTTDPEQVIGQALEQDWSAIGIKVKANALPQGAWIERAFEYAPIAIIGQWELPYPHGSYVVDSAFTQAAIDSGCCNFAEWSSPAFEELVVEGHETFDEPGLIDVYQQADTIVTQDEALWIPIIYPSYPVLKSARVQGYEVPGTPAADTLFLAQYWIEE
jgi:ABC-type transport system substrate-binding protein